jgi:hypothetical protein
VVSVGYRHHVEVATGGKVAFGIKNHLNGAGKVPGAVMNKSPVMVLRSLRPM